MWNVCVCFVWKKPTIHRSFCLFLPLVSGDSMQWRIIQLIQFQYHLNWQSVTATSNCKLIRMWSTSTDCELLSFIIIILCILYFVSCDGIAMVIFQIWLIHKLCAVFIQDDMKEPIVCCLKTGPFLVGKNWKVSNYSNNNIPIVCSVHSST